MEETKKKHHATEEEHSFHQGCPGSRMREIKRNEEKIAVNTNFSGQAIPSELTQWPVQIHLVPPTAPYFQNKELVVMSTCGQIASADVHWRYLKGRSVVIGCPKLDNTQPYVPKLAEILKETTIPKVIVVRMEVPCCGGLTMMVQQAVEMSGRTDLVVQEDVIGVDGSMKSVRQV